MLNLFLQAALGLAIVHYLTELNGDTVQVASLAEGLGPTFTVLLSFSTPEHGESIKVAQISNAIATTPLSKLRILAVDDEADIRDLMVAILEPTGAAIKVTASAIAALKTFPGFKPDILISDIGMPELDGYTLIQQIRRLSPDQGLHPQRPFTRTKSHHISGFHIRNGAGERSIFG